MQKWKREAILSVVLMLFSVAGFVYAGTMTTDLITVTAAKPDVYLRLWFVILFILSAVMLVNAMIKKAPEELPKIWTPLRIGTVALFAVYILVMPYIGFLISTLVFLMIVTTTYNLYVLEEIPKGGELAKRIAVYAVFTIVCTLITYYVFRYILSVNLPQGTLLQGLL